jgi:hypothetical protein
VSDLPHRFLAARQQGVLGAVCDLLTETLQREVQATSGAEPAGVSQSITLEMVDGEWRVSAFEG